MHLVPWNLRPWSGRMDRRSRMVRTSCEPFACASLGERTPLPGVNEFTRVHPVLWHFLFRDRQGRPGHRTCSSWLGFHGFIRVGCTGCRAYRAGSCRMGALPHQRKDPWDTGPFMGSRAWGKASTRPSPCCAGLFHDEETYPNRNWHEAWNQAAMEMTRPPVIRWAERNSTLLLLAGACLGLLALALFCNGV